jgi:Predicted Zn-dependent protease
MPMTFDSTYLLILIGAILCMVASGYLKSTYTRYSQIRSTSGLTGKEVAEQILYSQGIFDVTVEHVSGNLTDHYDPRQKKVCLSDATYASTSVAAIGVAAHECGHACQHHSGYVPLNWRSALVPIANLGSTIAWPLILVGLIFNNSSSMVFLHIGIIAFSFAVLFQVITLPVEFNASNRAIKILSTSGILNPQELPLSRKVLTAAALTYVAGTAASILQLLRIILLSNGRRRN